MTHTKHKEIMDIRMKSVLYGTQDLQQIAKIDRLIENALLQQLEELEGWVEGGKQIVPKDPLDITPREMMQQAVQPIYRRYVSNEESNNNALDFVLSHIREQKEVYKKQ